MRAFRIVLVGHGSLPAALLATTELIVGAVPEIAAVSLGAHETPDHFAEALRNAIGRDHRRVLVLADLLGGTPYNVAAAIARRSSRVVCVSGVNLAMTLEAALTDGQLTDEVVQRLVGTGRDGVVETSRHHAQRAS